MRWLLGNRVVGAMVLVVGLSTWRGYVAQRTGDNDLAALVATNGFVVSLEHLRDCDPDIIRIVYGVRVDREPGDGETPGIGP